MASETTSTIFSFNNAHHVISVKLTSTNYLFWKAQISLFLEGHNLMGFVDGSNLRPPQIFPQKFAQWVRQDKLIMSFLIASLSEDVFPKVIGLETSYDIWTALGKALASPSKTYQSVQEADQSVIEMDPRLYESAQVGNIGVLRQNKDQLHVELTGGGNTLLHVLAQFHDSAECVNAILEMKSSTIKQSMLMRKNSKGETALHTAANYGRSKIVQALIEHAKTLVKEELESGVHIAMEMMRATDQKGDIALHKAVRNKHVQVVKLLVEEDPHFPHPSNKMEETPLYLAVERNNHDMVDSILTTCESPASKGPGGKTALHAAVLNRCQDCIVKLLGKQPGLTKEVDEFGWTPLHYAASLGSSTSIMERLLKVDRSAAYIMEYKNNMTPLHVAACNGIVESMKELLKYSTDCWEMTTSKDQNILHLAVEYKREEAIDFILDNSWAANLVKEKDANGKTPIDLLYLSSNLRAPRLMEYYEAETDAFRKRNSTPLDMIHPKPYNINEEDKSGLPDVVRKLFDTQLIVATLVATVTFAAGFTVPGGYDGNHGPNQGMAVLARKAAFQAFVVFDTIAVISSIAAVFLHFVASVYLVAEDDEGKAEKRYAIASLVTIIAMIAMMVAFMMGLYTVLAPSFLGLAISVCFFGSFCILIFLWVLYRFIRFALAEAESG